MTVDIEKLKELALAASPGPWKGDRYDGTVKYTVLDANDDPVIRGDNGNSDSGPFGIDKEEDEAYLLGCHPAAVLELIAEVERVRADAARYQHIRKAQWFKAGFAKTEANASAFHYCGALLDQLVDAAIEARKAGKEEACGS
jgi:hypothetical protein